MANYQTQFSFIIPNMTDAEQAWIKQLQDEQERIDEGNFSDEEVPIGGSATIGFLQFAVDEWVGFEAEIEDGELWVHDGDGNGMTENAANFVQEFLRRFRPDKVFGFEWANTCSRPIADSYGGGAVFIRATDSQWMATSMWLADQIEKETA